MKTQSQKQKRVAKIVLAAILAVGNIWCSVDSFCEYAGTHRTKTLVEGIFFFVMIFWFAGRAISEYKLHKQDSSEVSES